MPAIEEYNRLTRETHDTVAQDVAGIQRQPDPQLDLQTGCLQEEVLEFRAFGGLVGRSAALSHLASQIGVVAPTDASVLILGETGTGKELVAHEIHFLTEAEVERFERDNLVAALEAANWKISGRDGAAELLGVKPTTLISRMAKWGLNKPENAFYSL